MAESSNTNFEQTKATYLQNNANIEETQLSIDQETTLYVLCPDEKVAHVNQLLDGRAVEVVSYDSFDCSTVKHYDLTQLIPVIKKLNTGDLDVVFCYGDVLRSTQTLAKTELAPLLGHYNYVTLAAIQTRGVGRGQNKWESVLGNIMVTMSTQIPAKVSSELHTLQYISGMAVVDTIQSFSDRPVAVNIKWPNDVVYRNGDALQKICGVLFESTTNGKQYFVHGGVGINVSGADKMVVKTTDVSSILGKKISREEVLSAYLKRFFYKTNVWMDLGFQALQAEYENKWMHSGQAVQVEGEEREVIIVGLDPSTWYLKAHSVITLHPDGNSFDAMHGLIKAKA